jgi:hypothetical protein
VPAILSDFTLYLGFYPFYSFKIGKGKMSFHLSTSAMDSMDQLAKEQLRNKMCCHQTTDAATPKLVRAPQQSQPDKGEHKCMA